jgi:tRNA(adenine34) deaminase
MISVMFENKYISMALQEAQKGGQQKEVPVGAVVVYGKEIISLAHNMTEELANPLAHAEMLAIAEALKILNTKYLTQCDLYITLEPCPMCTHAIFLARLKRVYFGAYAFPTTETMGYNIPNHHTEFYGGVMEQSCAELLKNFFSQLR